ncbi:MAG: hypothetical protein M1838_003166 [Thelocarpon superellum]|nr:MAG: hypothetical protein M1838_003166 [Thelocarpon superellum]
MPPFPLVVFDFDGTLIQEEVIDEIARIAGVEEQVAAITAKAMNGEMDFTESFLARVQLLKGTPVAVFQQVRAHINITPGAFELCKALKASGCKLAVLSGGFTPVVHFVAAQLGVDYAHSNHLAYTSNGDHFTGQVIGRVVDAQRKADLLLDICKLENMSPSQAVVIGDGANDLLMMKQAGRAIAFDGKAAVRKHVPRQCNGNLLDVIYHLGYDPEELRSLIDFDETKVVHTEPAAEWIE